MAGDLEAFTDALIGLADRLGAAAESADWELAARLDAELDQRLRAAAPALARAEPGERAVLASCLARVQRGHEKAMLALTAARDAVGGELAGTHTAHRQLGQYLANAAG